MRVIPPVTMNDARLTSSTAAEPAAGETAYAAGTTYAVDAEVYRATTHRRYRSLAASNIGNAPESSPEQWEDIGPTNRWAMFDLVRNSQTVAASPLVVEILPGERVNSVAVLGLAATSVLVEVVVGGVVQFSRAFELLDRPVADWYSYFFAPFATRPSAIAMNLPPFTGATIRITITNTGGDVRCGACIVGTYVELGDPEYNATSDARNFSSVERDAQGNAKMNQQRNIPLTRQRLHAHKERTNTIIAARASLNGMPAVWSGMDADNTDGWFDALLILGFFTRFAINVAHPREAIIDLELEEI